MNPYLRHLSFALLCVFVAACGGETKPNKTQKTAVETKKLDPNAKVFTSIPDDMRVNLFNKVDYIDYIWYELPFAISQQEPEAVRANLTYIGYEAFPHGQTKCPKAMGRKFFHSNGEIIAEAEIYLSQNCNYYLFMDGNTELYTSQISDVGVRFYMNLFSNIQNNAPK